MRLILNTKSYFLTNFNQNWYFLLIAGTENEYAGIVY